MKILFVFTGGTIGSTYTGDYISTDKNKPYILLKKYKDQFGADFEYDTIQPYSVLSENNNGDTLKTLAESLSAVASGNYDGIIVTHGTDTLQYSAAMLSYTLDPMIPVCLVSSNRPIEDRAANGLINLHAAVGFIEKEGKAGVWVSYKNEDDNAKIHRGTRLLAGQAFTDSVYSLKDSCYGSFDQGYSFLKNQNYKEKENEIPYFGWGNIKSVSDGIMRIEPYTGMSYPELKPSVKYILMGSYHSGTVNTCSREALAFYKEARDRGVKVFLTGVSQGESYESTKDFDRLGIIPVRNISPIAAYVKLWLSVASDIDPEAVMNMSLSGDIVP